MSWYIAEKIRLTEVIINQGRQLFETDREKFLELFGDTEDIEQKVRSMSIDELLNWRFKHLA